MSRQGREMSGYCAEKAAVPIEEALMAFALVDISRVENFSLEKEKGIPFISFVVKEKEGAVFIEPHPLFMADHGTDRGQRRRPAHRHLYAGQQGKVCNWCPFCREKTGDFFWIA